MNVLSERLKQIRVLNGYSMEEVAECIGITKQSISKYETGKTFPSSEILNKIIQFYGLPAGYLIKPISPCEIHSHLFYRKGQRTSQHELEDAKIRMLWYYEILWTCSRFTHIPAADLPCLEEDLSIEEKSAVLRRYWGVPYGPIKNLAELLKEHGIHLFSTSLENNKIDGYSQIINGHPIIVLNQSKGSLMRKNFSLAHELGHLILHGDKTNLDFSQIEEEADLFAANFLMPMEEFKKDIIHIDVDTLIRLGEKWYVSPQAVLERCKRLGLMEQEETIRQAQRAYLLKRLNAVKNYYVPEEEIICSIKKVLEKIDADTVNGEKFINEICFPIPMMQKLLFMPDLFERWRQMPDEAKDIEGVQLTFSFQ